MENYEMHMACVMLAIALKNKEAIARREEENAEQAWKDFEKKVRQQKYLRSSK